MALIPIIHTLHDAPTRFLFTSAATNFHILTIAKRPTQQFQQLGIYPVFGKHIESRGVWGSSPYRSQTLQADRPGIAVDPRDGN
jgi:hypothetical protein